MVSGKMNGLKKLGMIGAAGVALVAALLLITQAWGASGTLWLTDANTTPDGTATVDVVAEVGDPGLGAWTLDVVFDLDLLNVVDCEEFAGSVCNPDFKGGTLVRVTGASASGHDEETVLATITFQCKGEGVATIDAFVEVFADATIGDPQPIDVEVLRGEFACKEAPDPTDTPPVEDTVEPLEATDAPAVPTALPPTGSGGSGNGGSATAWFIVALAAAGLAGIAGFGALRLRRN